MFFHFYDREALKAELVDLGSRNPRQGSALARACGVKPASANRWLKAGEPTTPSPEHWEAIEKFFGLRAGHLASVAGASSKPSKGSRVDRLEDELGELRRRVDRLERMAARTLGDHALAANAGDPRGVEEGPDEHRPSPDGDDGT